MIVRIVVIRPTDEAHVLSFDQPGEVIIGRGPACQCRLDFDPLVSRRHARLRVGGSTVTLQDLDSRNGLQLNGRHYGGKAQLKMADPYIVSNGDMIKIGDTALSVLISSNETAGSVDSSLLRRVRNDAANPPLQDSWTEFPVDSVAHQIPGYRIEGIVGAGGMGMVYQARRKADGLRVAIKTMHPGTLASDKMMINFHREIEVTKKIEHPNIVKFHDSGTTVKDMIYLVLEFVGGGDLSRLLDNAPGNMLQPREAHRLALQIASGMAHAHRLGIIHRDIKPQNILLGGDDNRQVKISDLGLAKHFDNSEASGHTGSCAGGGTMAYMPPEQLTNFRDAKPYSDVFSVGATLYEMLTSHGPYDFSGGDKLKAVSSALLIPLRKWNIPMPDSLASVVTKCLAPVPLDRFADCGELEKALREVVW